MSFIWLFFSFVLEEIFVKTKRKAFILTSCRSIKMSNIYFVHKLIANKCTTISFDHHLYHYLASFSEQKMT